MMFCKFKPFIFSSWFATPVGPFTRPGGSSKRRVGPRTHPCAVTRPGVCHKGLPGKPFSWGSWGSWGASALLEASEMYILGSIHAEDPLQAKHWRAWHPAHGHQHVRREHGHHAGAGCCASLGSSWYFWGLAKSKSRDTHR